jgi:hypothetical protein
VLETVKDRRGCRAFGTKAVAPGQGEQPHEAADEAPWLTRAIARSPGYARFFVFTGPEIERVQFLPEQIEPLDDGATVEV